MPPIPAMSSHLILSALRWWLHLDWIFTIHSIISNCQILPFSRSIRLALISDKLIRFFFELTTHVRSNVQLFSSTLPRSRMKKRWTNTRKWLRHMMAVICNDAKMTTTTTMIAPHFFVSPHLSTVINLYAYIYYITIYVPTMNRRAKMSQPTY